MSCPYKDIFGKPGEKIHSTRIFGLAAFDTLGTILISFLIAYSFKMCFWKTFAIIFILGEILHYLFGVQTAFLTFFKITACNK